MAAQKKLLILFAVSLGSVAVLFSLERIKQDSAYHLFADSRLVAQVPNFLNVITNLPFIVVGFLGLRVSVAQQKSTVNATARLPYLLFFLGVFLTGFGSAYYHLCPDNFSLLWDRLPLALSTMALLCAVICDCISEKIGLRLLFPLILLALASVLYWYVSEMQGQGDLRPYIWVQFLPFILLPLILWFYDGNQNDCAYVWALLGVYILAKIAEALDAAIYGQLAFSGHSVKHLLAGAGTYIVYAALRQRLHNKPGM